MNNIFYDFPQLHGPTLHGNQGCRNRGQEGGSRVLASLIVTKLWKPMSMVIKYKIANSNCVNVFRISFSHHR